MAVAVAQFQRPQEFRPEPEQKVDPMDQILKGLQIASTVYGIKHNIDQNDLNKLQQTKYQQDITAQENTAKALGEETARLKDPNSQESIQARAVFERITGQKVPEGTPAYNMKNLLDTKKMLEIEATGKASFEKAKELEGVKAGFQKESQVRKAESDLKLAGAKSEKLDKTLEIPGYKISPDVQPSKIEARQMRDAVSDSKTLNKLIEDTAEIARNASKFDLANPMSDVRNKIQNNLKQAQLLYKGPSFAQLGVLAGPDMEILDSIIENPVTMSSLAKGTEGVVSRLKSLTDSVNANVSNKLNVRGYIPNAEAPQQDAKSTAAPKLDLNAIEKEIIRRKGLSAGIGK